MAKYFPGFDVSFYPGDTVMQSLWDHTNLYWCGFYLGGRFNWTGHYKKIKSMGWGTAPIYTGKQPISSAALKAIATRFKPKSAELKQALYDNGLADGKEAATQARKDNIPSATILYFDVENAVADLNWFQYYRGWSRAVVNNYYCVGLYTRPSHASWVQAQLISQLGFDICFPEVWVAYYTRANANGATVPAHDFLPNPFPERNPADAWPGASSWQHLGNFGLKWEDKTNPQKPKAMRFSPADLNSSVYSDPGLGILSVL